MYGGKGRWVGGEGSGREVERESYGNVLTAYKWHPMNFEKKKGEKVTLVYESQTPHSHLFLECPNHLTRDGPKLKFC